MMKKTVEKKKRNIWKSVVAIALVGVLGVSAAAIFSARSFGAFDEANAITFGEYRAANAIEDCTLFIGTWLIHKDSLTEDNYDKAVSSVADSGQDIKYYKSELADGAWFDISSASSLLDISEGATVTPVEELDKYYVEFIVGKDGRMKNARGDEVNPFNTPDPYDLKNLQELQSVWFQYAQDSSTSKEVNERSYLKDHNSEAKDREESDKYIFKKVDAFWNSNVRTDETNQLDAAVNALYQYSLTLKDADRNNDADVVNDLCAKVDHRRRAIVFSLLEEVEDNYLSQLYDGASGAYLQSAPEEEKDADGNAIPVVRPQESIDGPFFPDEAMLDAISDAMGTCKDSYNEHANSELSDSDTILGHLEYQYSDGVIQNAGTAAADEPLRHLSYVVAIRDSKINDSDGELSELDQTMIPPSESAYRTAAIGGESPDYVQAKNSGVASAQSSALLEDQEKDTEGKRSELQFFIKAKTDRMKSADALKYTEERISWTEALLPLVPQDDFNSQATNSINAHLKWLRDLAEEIKNRDSSLNSNLDELVEEKNDLLKDKQQALDNNDLAEAARLDKLIGVVDDKIKDEQKNANDGGAAGVANDLLSDALGTMGEEGPDSDSMKNIMDALGGIGATDQLNQLKDALGNAGASASTLNACDDALQAAADSNIMNAALSGSGYDIAGMSDDDLLALLMSLLGKNSWNQLSDAEKAILVATLAELGDKGFGNCSRLAALLGSKLFNDEHCKYIYKKYTGSGGSSGMRWISLQTVGDITPYRYVYNDTRSVATLAGTDGSYEISIGSLDAKKGDKVITLQAKPVLQSRLPYAAEGDCQEYFDVTCDNFGTSDYAVALTSALRAKVKEMMDTLTGQSGGE